MSIFTKIYAADLPKNLPINQKDIDLYSLINNIILKIIFPVAGILAVLYLVYSGILYITAAGNAENAKKGQQGVTNAIIGIFVISLSYTIVRAVTKSAAAL